MCLYEKERIYYWILYNIKTHQKGPKETSRHGAEVSQIFTWVRSVVFDCDTIQASDYTANYSLDQEEEFPPIPEENIRNNTEYDLPLVFEPLVRKIMRSYEKCYLGIPRTVRQT